MKYKGRLVVKGKRVSKNEKLKKLIERKVENKYGSHEIYSGSQNSTTETIRGLSTRYRACSMKNRDIYWRRYKIQETLYIGQWHCSPLQSRHLRTSHSSSNHTSAALSYFPESHQQSEIPCLSKVILVLGKARSCRGPNLGYSGAESPGWFDVSPKNSAWDVMHEWVCCHDEAANHHLPIAAAFWIIQIVSAEECSSLAQNVMQIHCSTLPFWMRWPHSTHAQSMASTAPSD